MPCDCLYRRQKFPISVIFYFVMKVSRGSEKEEMHHKSLPWEDRVGCTHVCDVRAGPTARWVDVLFTAAVLSVCVHLPLRVWRGSFFNWQVKKETVHYTFLPLVFFPFFCWDPSSFNYSTAARKRFYGRKGLRDLELCFTGIKYENWVWVFYFHLEGEIECNNRYSWGN